MLRCRVQVAVDFGTSVLRGQSYGLRQSSIDDNSELAQAEAQAAVSANAGPVQDLRMDSKSIVQDWMKHPRFLAVCMLLESLNLVSSTIYVVEAHQRAVLTELSATCSDGTALVPVLAAECQRWDDAALNSMNNCDAVAIGDICEADALTADRAHCGEIIELQNCGVYDVYKTTACDCAILARVLWASSALSLFCTVGWTCRFYTNRLGPERSQLRRRHHLIYAVLASELLLITFLGFLGSGGLGGGVAVLLMALMCPALALLVWFFALVVVTADDGQAQVSQEVDFRVLRRSAALELPLFNVLVAFMLEKEKIQELNKLRAPLQQGLRLLEDLPECAIGAVDLYYFGGSWFSALGISMSLLMVILQLVMAMSAKVLAKARHIAGSRCRETE